MIFSLFLFILVFFSVPVLNGPEKMTLVDEHREVDVTSSPREEQTTRDFSSRTEDVTNSDFVLRGSTTTTFPLRIENVTMTPLNPRLHDVVSINATIINETANLQSVMLHYQVNGSNWTNVSMLSLGNAVYTADIPPQPNGTVVNWFITATTTDNNTVSTEGIKNGGFETGTFGEWSSQYASVLNVLAHSGQYSARIGFVSFTTVSTGYIEQAVHVPTSMVKGLSFYMDYDDNKVVNVTIFYHDGTNSTHSVVAGYYWTRAYINGSEMNAGKTITAIRIEKPVVDGKYLFVDDVSLITLGSYVVNNGAAPVISNVTRSPINPSKTDTVNVSAIITDDYDEIDQVYLVYQVNGSGWIKNLMNNNSKSFYWSTIPVQGAGSVVEYYIEANDSDGNIANTLKFANGGFESGVLDPWYTYGGVLQDKTYMNEAKFVYSGQYGFKLSALTYNGTFYEAPAYLEQDVWIPVEEVSELSFYMKAIDKSYLVTVIYSDGSNSTFSFDPSSTWIKRTIKQSELLGGKIISTIRFETLQITDNPAAIDQIMLATYTVSDGFTPFIYDVTQSPTNPENNDTVIISATILEDNAVNSAMLFYRVNVNASWTTVPMSLLSGNNYFAQIPAQAVGTVVEYYINVTDVDGYSSRTPLYQYVVTDLTPPLILTLTRMPSLPTNIDDVTIAIQAYDTGTSIDQVTVSFQINEGAWQVVSATFNGTHYVAMIPAQSYGTNVTYFVIVRDTAGNEMYSSMDAYTVIDGIPPQILDVNFAPVNPTTHDTVTITAAIIDSESGIVSVNLSYQVNGGTWNIETMIEMNGTYIASIPSQSHGDVVSFYISARDLQGNVNMSSTFSYTVTDGRAPSIETIEQVPSDQITDADSVIIMASITDLESGIANVTLEHSINDTNNWISQVMAFNVTLGRYIGTIPAQPAGTTVYYRIIAFDQQGNSNTSMIMNYVVITTNPPTSTTTTTPPTTTTTTTPPTTNPPTSTTTTPPSTTSSDPVETTTTTSSDNSASTSSSSTSSNDQTSTTTSSNQNSLSPSAINTPGWEFYMILLVSTLFIVRRSRHRMKNTH